MPSLIASFLELPTVLFTVPLGLSLLYWLLVILGAIDLDLFHSAASVGKSADGVLHGAAEGVAHGSVEGAVEGAAHGAAEGAAKGALEGALHASSLAFVASVLRVGRVPVTVSLSLLWLVAWVLSGIGSAVALEVVPAGPFALLARVCVGVGALVLGALITNRLVRPLERLFRTGPALTSNDLIGRVCRLTTTTIDGRHGQAQYLVGGMDLTLQVRCPAPNTLTKGDQVVLLDYDAARRTYRVQAYRALLEELRTEGEET